MTQLTNAITDGKRFKLRIGIYSSSSIVFYGGGEVIAIQVANHLVESRYDVTVYSDSKYGGRVRLPSSKINDILKSKHVFTPYESSRALFLPAFLYQPLPSTEELNNNDVSLIFLYRLPRRSYLANLIKSGESKCVFLLHGIVFDQFNSGSLRVLLYQQWVKFLFKRNARLYKNSKFFFQIFSKPNKDFLLSNGLSSQNIFVIPNGTDFRKYKVGRNDNEFIVIFLGRLDTLHKGIKLLKNVIGNTTLLSEGEMIFSIVGSGPASRDIENFASNHKNVRYAGFVSEEEKVYQLLNANLLILTSNVDPFPLSIIEGLASGLPIVTTPVSGAIAMISLDPILGTVTTYKENSYSKSILSYYDSWLKDKNAYHEKKVKRRELAAGYFSLERMIADYENMIKSLVGAVFTEDV